VVLTGSNVSLQSNGVTSAHIANRTRNMSFTGAQFLTSSNTSGFDLGNGTGAANRASRVFSFAGANGAGGMTLSFVVPQDYVGPTAADTTACPGLVTPRLRIKWATDSTQANGARKINMDVLFSQDDQLVANSLANRFRYNIRSAASGSDAAESLDPTNTQIADQLVPEAGDNWSTGEGALNAWVPGQVIVLTLYRNATSTEDPNSARAGILNVSFEYEADQ
jgi:hypothetical protein